MSKNSVFNIEKGRNLISFYRSFYLRKFLFQWLIEEVIDFCLSFRFLFGANGKKSFFNGLSAIRTNIFHCLISIGVIKHFFWVVRLHTWKGLWSKWYEVHVHTTFLIVYFQLHISELSAKIKSVMWLSYNWFRNPSHVSH